MFIKLFKNNNRKLPINFEYPEFRRISICIKIPDNYSLVTKPNPIKVSLPNKAGRFIFNVSEANGMIVIYSHYERTKTDFVQNEYALLKEFFGLIVNKHSESIILKRE